MKYSRWIVLIFPVLTVMLLVWAYDRMHWVYAVGSINLTIEYQVVDSATEVDIPGARIDFRADEGKPRARGFIVADSTGHAQHQFPDATISTQSSGHHWTVREAVYLPAWNFAASAPGYKTSQWQYLHRYRHEMHVGNRHATLKIPVRLEK